MQAKTAVIVSLSAFFGVIFAVNGFMMYNAFTSHDGLVTDHEYAQALHYNDVIQQQKRQARLGWQVTLDAPKRIGDGVSVAVTGSDGVAVSGAQVAVAFERPTEMGLDAAATMVESAAGTYAGPVTLKKAGHWDAVIRIDRGTDRYVTRRRIRVAG
ncbi:MAG: FixH family protein [Candidatus Sericytochromatia bacterium]|nr:FixH family protein [Candidatus Sericytochromatia bacterium]